MIVAGFGFRQTATVASLRDALARAEGPAPAVLATETGKARSNAIQDLASQLSVPIQPVQKDQLASQSTQTQSAASHAAYGTGSVAEASALAAAGPGARLLTPRVISSDGMATCALACEAPEGETS